MDVHVSILLSIIIYVCGSVNASQVLLVSMDGFRWDYLHKVSTPNFDRLARYGTRAEYINITFITKTFPCHYSIATGKSRIEKKLWGCVYECKRYKRTKFNPNDLTSTLVKE